jgi:hypothetical protein
MLLRVCNKSLHELVLPGNQLLEVDAIVVGGGGVGLAIALVVPCGHHLADWLDTDIRFYGTPTICNKRYMEYAAILFIKDEVKDKVPKQPTTPIKHTQSRQIEHQTQRELTTLIATHGSS